MNSNITTLLNDISVIEDQKTIDFFKKFNRKYGPLIQKLPNFILAKLERTIVSRLFKIGDEHPQIEDIIKKIIKQYEKKKSYDNELNKRKREIYENVDKVKKSQEYFKQRLDTLENNCSRWSQHLEKLEKKLLTSFASVDKLEKKYEYFLKLIADIQKKIGIKQP